MSEAALCLTEQIKPQHIVGEDSLDNDEEPRKGERRYAWFIQGESRHLIVWYKYICYGAIQMCDLECCR